MSRIAICAFLCLLSSASAQSKPEFEVATLKPNTSGGGVALRSLAGGTLNAENTSLRVLIRVAYNVEDFQISGGPGWVNSDRYDVNAKAEGNATFEQMRPMLQSLLADRFKLILHSETKERSEYEMAAAKGGLKIAPSKEGSCIAADPKNPPPTRPGEPPPRFCDNLRFGRGLIEAFGISMPRLAEALSNVLGRTVIDKTGFTGSFDVHLAFTPEESINDGADSSDPSIFTALQEQLGLRLESAKGPVEVLVIDHVEKPSEN